MDGLTYLIGRQYLQAKMADNHNQFARGLTCNSACAGPAAALFLMGDPELSENLSWNGWLWE